MNSIKGTRFEFDWDALAEKIEYKNLEASKNLHLENAHTTFVEWCCYAVQICAFRARGLGATTMGDFVDGEKTAKFSELAPSIREQYYELELEVEENTELRKLLFFPDLFFEGVRDLEVKWSENRIDTDGILCIRFEDFLDELKGNHKFEIKSGEFQNWSKLENREKEDEISN